MSGTAGPAPTIGVMLPSAAFVAGGSRGLTVAEAARHAEESGFDSVWVGDHLMTGGPVLDATLVLATAAAATRHLSIGSGVLLAGMRPLAWLAKQIATLQVLSGNRFVLGVGSGGPWPDEWAAAGIRYDHRGPRTDLALALLPRLLAGDPVTHQAFDGPAGPDRRLPREVVVRLAPAAPMPPVWVGGGSAVARRRAVEHGDAWFPSMVLPDDLMPASADLAERSAATHRTAPAIAVGLVGSLGADGIGRHELAAGIAGSYGVDTDRATALPITGSADEVAARLHEYRAAGADHLVIGLAGPDWRHQIDLLATSTAQLR